MNRDQLIDQLTELRALISDLADAEEITEEQDAELERALADEAEATAQLAELDRRAAAIAAVTSRDDLVRSPGVPEVMHRVDPTEVDMRRATRGELRDAALSLLESEVERGAARDLADRQAENVERLIRTQNGNTDGSQIARRLLATENDAYRSAFIKGTTQAQPAWTSEEARAVDEFRAMSEGTDTAGGFGVPVLIDPSIILTSGAAAAPVLQLARTETITTDAWKGVSTAGVSWSYDAEAAAVSDDAPTLAQPTVTVYMARGFIPYSIEVGQDYPGFAAEMRRLLDAGYVDLVASQTITGSGSAPQGIFTALDANTNVEVSVETAGSFAMTDVLALWKALPERYRGTATWVMSTDVENNVRALAADNRGYYTVDASAGGIGTLFGRPIRTTDYAPDLPTATTAANVMVVGDFQNFLVAQRAGMNVELVPHVFDVTNNRPTGERGWFAYARHGFDSVNDLGFRLLTNT